MAKEKETGPTKGINRRAFLKGAAAAGVMATGPFIITRPGWSQTGPIKIGALEPRSGPTKYVGDMNIAAADFAIERINAAGGVLGREMKFVVADSEMKPDVAARRGNELLLGEKVDFITSLGGHLAKIVAQLAHQNNKLYVSPHTVASEMTGKEFLPTTFICALNTEMVARTLAAYFARSSPRKYTKFYLLNQDYNMGRDTSLSFKEKFERIKGPNQAIVGEEYFPMFKLKDFAPYITKVMASGADVLVTSAWAQDNMLLLKQGKELGWNVKVAGYFLNDPTLIQAIGPATVGHLTAGIHMSTVDTPENKAFVKAWFARYPNAPIAYKTPELLIGRGVYAWLWLADIIKKAGSLETEKLIKAWEGAKFKTAWGEAEMRACDHQMQSPCYVAEAMEPEKIPEEIRYHGNEMPFIGRPTMIPKEEISIPPKETGNVRCT
jgi:branched-chain amino acid transport system substrate-binding protein